MHLSNSIPSDPDPQDDFEVSAETRDVIAGVAHALWEERKRRHLPDDPDADWLRAEQLVKELRSHRPPGVA